MVLTKSEDARKQGFCKVLWRKLRLRVGLLLSLIGVFEVGSGVGWALIRGWALIKCFCLQDGRLSEVGANSRLGAYSNKYGIWLKWNYLKKKLKNTILLGQFIYLCLFLWNIFPYSNRFFSSLHPNVGFQRKKRVIFLWKGIFGEKVRKEAKSV